MFRVIISVLCACALTACGAIRDDLRYPGGAGGRILDKRTFDASRSRSLELWRASLMLAIAAQIGEGSVEAADADAFARQLGDAANEINFAAAEIGYPVVSASDESVRTACTIFQKPGVAGQLDAWDGQSLDDATQDCPGYYVNFESHVARVETRIARAMLTALPTDKAKAFLNHLAKGDLLSALLSLPGSVRQVAGSFHRGAGVYRTGTEAMAAMVSSSDCDRMDASYHQYADRAGWGYRESQDTVLIAAACLGLSQHDLFDSTVLEGDRLYRQTIRPRAFHAMFQVARASCVALPITGTLDDKAYTVTKKARNTSCGSLVFKPAVQPLSIMDEASADAQEQADAGDEADAPQDEAAESDVKDVADDAASAPPIPPTSPIGN